MIHSVIVYWSKETKKACQLRKVVGENFMGYTGALNIHYKD